MISDRFQQLRLLEAALFASAEPLKLADLARLLPQGADVKGLLSELQGLYANRGVVLERSDDAWAMRTAWDLAPLLQRERVARRKLSRAAADTLAIIAYQQPMTRAEIEEVRGVALSKGTLDTLLEAGWVQPKGRRETPGRPLLWGTTPAFLDHFGLESLKDLPGMEELKAAGLLDSRPAVTALGERGLLPPADGAEEKEERLEENFAEHLQLEEPEEGQGGQA
ncbi:MAG TPA: SMC-Scp complex subunit ScpB [Kiloniellales bacterium]|nr:SMC-Scp complex subunit ScpB [Kiloniellales bacterium]